MIFTFYKFEGCGNDFIILDDRDNSFSAYFDKVELLCHRKFGIGADGLILIRKHEEADFEMVYFNSDGKIASMCGNGSRCAVSFAHDLELIGDQCRFMAADGIHKAEIREIVNENKKIVAVNMCDVDKIEVHEDFVFLDTGSPHVVINRPNIDVLDVVKEGRKVRFNDRFKNTGTNVNFIEREFDVLKVRTYERGVENETMSCGTGVTASAIAAGVNGRHNECKIKTPGGELLVTFNKQNGSATDVWLQGPAVFVYKGEKKLSVC